VFPEVVVVGNAVSSASLLLVAVSGGVVVYIQIKLFHNESILSLSPFFSCSLNFFKLNSFVFFLLPDLLALCRLLVLFLCFSCFLLLLLLSNLLLPFLLYLLLL